MRPVPRGCRGGFFDGRYKVDASDFTVEEVAAYEPSGQGPHVWLWIEKRGLSTIDVLRGLSRRLGCHERALGIAGLKDARSVSRQWISVAASEINGDVNDAAFRDLSDERVTVLAVSRHSNKLRLGHLRGNRFRILLRGTCDDDLGTARDNLNELAAVGVPNYFGEQRFGKRGANLPKGLEVLRGNPRAIARRMPRRVFGLVISAVQSEVFNRVVAARLDSLGTLQPGDLAVLHKNGAVFAVDNPAREQARADALELSPSGPMPGPDMMQPNGEPLAVEQAVMAELQLSGDEFRDLPFKLARGERRPLRMPVSDVGAEWLDDGDRRGLQLAFTLPKGGYATAVLRELLTDTIWFGPLH